MTPLSLVPEQAQHQGISYGELVERLIDEALSNERRACPAAAARRARQAAQGVARSPCRRRSPSACRSTRRAPTSSPAWSFGAFLLAIGRRRADRARHPGEGRRAAGDGDRPRGLHASAATRSSGINHMNRALVDASSPTSFTALRTRQARQGAAAAGRCRRDPRAAAAASAGSRTRACRAGCPTRW